MVSTLHALLHMVILSPIVFNNTKTNGYALSLNSGSSTNLTFDANGNMTQDQLGNTYSWDAEDRLIKITYPGSGNHSDFTYDSLGRNVKILEYTSGSLTDTRQFVWSSNERREARDASGVVTGQYFPGGEIFSSTSYYFTKDRLGSVRDMYASGIQAQYCADPFGREMKISETVPADFGFCGYYIHGRSGLSLTRTRAYNADLGRFINRDSVGEDGGLNLFAYVQNAPTEYRDASGLWGDGCQWGNGPKWGCPNGDCGSDPWFAGPGGVGAPTTIPVHVATIPQTNSTLPHPPPPRRRGYCRSTDCCLTEFSNCQSMCKTIMDEYWIDDPSYEWRLQECYRCCAGRKSDCLGKVNSGKTYPKWRFDECWQIHIPGGAASPPGPYGGG